MFFDPLYILFSLPALLLALFAQTRVKANFSKYSRVATMQGITGSQVARNLLDAKGLSRVKVERTQGFMSAHYDPRTKVLRLSPAVHDQSSVAAAGIAAHETGHALQDAQNYSPLGLRSLMVPSVRLGSWMGPILFFIGYLINFIGLAWIGLALFAATVMFALVTLPVEFDASRRAKNLLLSHGVLASQEMTGVNKVLNAAALTYLAGALQAISTLLYYGFLLMGRRD